MTGPVLAHSGYSGRIVIAIAAVLLAGCGSEVDRGGLVVDRGRSATAHTKARWTSATRSRRWSGDKTPYQRAEPGYDDGLATVQANAEAALDDYMRKSGPIYSTPSNGYSVEREKDGRVLFSYDVDGRMTASMSASDGVRDRNGDEGWGVRAWAQCDPSELPGDVTDELNIGVAANTT